MDYILISSDQQFFVLFCFYELPQLPEKVQKFPYPGKNSKK